MQKPFPADTNLKISDLPLLDSVEMDMRWGDQDSYGHLNNTLYFRFFEEARVQWLQRLGFAVDGQGTGPVVVQTGATYLKPVNYPCRLRVTLRAASPGRSSLPLYHEIFDSATGALYGEGFVKLVWVDHQQNKSVPLPDALRATIDGL